MTKTIFARLLSILLVTALFLAHLATQPVNAADGYPFEVNDPEVSDALDYLRAQQSPDGNIGGFANSAWVIMAVAAAGENPADWKQGVNPSIVGYLATNAGSASSATDYARMVLAIVAAGGDPTAFGSRDFISLLNAEYDGTQIGDDSLINDDLWGVMGLVAAGVNPTSPVITGSVDFMKLNQNTDGGWSWSVGQPSDVDDTAAAIMTLIAAGESASSTVITNALAYIKSTQMANGGFESWGSTNADTNSWSIDAIVAAAQDPTGDGWPAGSGNDPIDDLLSFQQTDGSFYYMTGSPGMSVEKTTACAITALLGKPFPTVVLATQEGVTVDVRIEGQVDTIWSGSVTVTESWITATDSGTEYHLENPTALGAMDEAAQVGEFDYETTDQWGSPFVTSINAEEGLASGGWMYRVNYYSPMVGSADFVLNETTPPSPIHHEVLFYNAGSWTEVPLKIDVEDVAPGVGESFTVTVLQYNDTTHDWSPCESATVHANQDYTTGQDGTVAITINNNLTLDIYAEKEGFTRSNKVTVTVGEGADDDGDNIVNLQADILPAISFHISPGSIDFGTLGPRDTSAPTPLTIANTGAWEIKITATVMDESEGLYENGITLGGMAWDQYINLLARGNESNCDVTLHVPEQYASAGQQEGALIFWAEEAQ
jgi:hypothetical protein